MLKGSLFFSIMVFVVYCFPSESCAGRIPNTNVPKPGSLNESRKIPVRPTIKKPPRNEVKNTSPIPSLTYDEQKLHLAALRRQHKDEIFMLKVDHSDALRRGDKTAANQHWKQIRVLQLELTHQINPLLQKFNKDTDSAFTKKVRSDLFRQTMPQLSYNGFEQCNVDDVRGDSPGFWTRCLHLLTRILNIQAELGLTPDPVELACQKPQVLNKAYNLHWYGQ
jgi:hypothetical protein